MSLQEEDVVREAFHSLRRPEDKFIYDIVTVRSFEDALIAILVNPNIQACPIRYEFPYKSKYNLSALRRYLEGLSEKELESKTEAERSLLLSSMIGEIRPEIDQFLVASGDVEVTASSDIRYFKRIFYRETDYIEQHHTILRAIDDSYRTPFFAALREYSRKPTGVFHAMPISRGGVDTFYDPITGWNKMEEAWAHDEFVVDPSRITVAIGKPALMVTRLKTNT